MRIPILSDIHDRIKNFFTWIWNESKWIYAAIVAFILTPINWTLDQLNSLVTAVTGYWTEIDGYLDKTGFYNISDYWAAAGPYFSKANAVVPINFAATIFMVLCALWLACQVVRLLLRFIPFGSG